MWTNLAYEIKDLIAIEDNNNKAGHVVKPDWARTSFRSGWSVTRKDPCQRQSFYHTETAEQYGKNLDQLTHDFEALLQQESHHQEDRVLQQDQTRRTKCGWSVMRTGPSQTPSFDHTETAGEQYGRNLDQLTHDFEALLQQESHHQKRHVILEAIRKSPHSDSCMKGGMDRTSYEYINSAGGQNIKKIDEMTQYFEAPLLQESHSQIHQQKFTERRWEIEESKYYLPLYPPDVIKTELDWTISEGSFTNKIHETVKPLNNPYDKDDDDDDESEANLSRKRKRKGRACETFMSEAEYETLLSLEEYYNKWNFKKYKFLSDEEI